PIPGAGHDFGAGPVTDTAAVGRFTRKALRRMRELGLQTNAFQGTGRIDVAEVEKAAAMGRGHSPQDCDPIDESPSKLLEASRLSETYRAVVPSLVAVSVSSKLVQEHLRSLAASIGPITYLELVIREAAVLLPDY